jgi:hypothetical protein
MQLGKSAKLFHLGVELTASPTEIRKAYLEKAQKVHPDRRQPTSKTIDDTSDFDVLHNAYIHLMEEGGNGNQSNPAHSLNALRICIC